MFSIGLLTLVSFIFLVKSSYLVSWTLVELKQQSKIHHHLIIMPVIGSNSVDCWFPKCGPQTRSVISPESLLKMQTLRPHRRTAYRISISEDEAQQSVLISHPVDSRAHWSLRATVTETWLILMFVWRRWTQITCEQV